MREHQLAAEKLSNQIRALGPTQSANVWIRYLQAEIEVQKENCVNDPLRALEYAGAVKVLRKMIVAAGAPRQ